jgi:molecular chaperone GrpE (heat shock protein)
MAYRPNDEYHPNLSGRLYKEIDQLKEEKGSLNNKLLLSERRIENFTKLTRDQSLRIAELEARLKRVCKDYQRSLDEMEKAGIQPSADVVKYFNPDGEGYPALQEAIQEALSSKK